MLILSDHREHGLLMLVQTNGVDVMELALERERIDFMIQNKIVHGQAALKTGPLILIRVKFMTPTVIHMTT